MNQSASGTHRQRQLAQARDDRREARVALLVAPGFEYSAAQWGIWRAGGIKVPLCLSATEGEWEYALTDSGASILATIGVMAPRVRPLCERLGENGYQHVKQNFLLTRHVKDYMLVMLALDHPDEDIIHLD